MAQSRQTRLKSEQFQKNITKRGIVESKEGKVKESSTSNVNPLLFGFLIFIFVGSTLFQIIRTAQSGPIF